MRMAAARKERTGEKGKKETKGPEDAPRGSPEFLRKAQHCGPKAQRKLAQGNALGKRMKTTKP